MHRWFLVLLLSFWLHAAFGAQGYPGSGPAIVSEEDAKIKNAFCFPIVVSVNGQSYDVGPHSEASLGSKTWTPWHWMPGRLSGPAQKKVRHPLTTRPKPSFGPGSPPTHVGPDQYGYDFAIGEGTPVYAMEKGLVIRVIENYSEAHQDEKRKAEGNIIEVLHDDGTVARYSHLQKNSAKVKPCDTVDAGTNLGLSGNTGYSSGPHLHVDVFRATSGNSYVTIPLEFE